MPAFVVTLAGLQIWQGVIQKSIEKQGVIVIQDEPVNNTANYFFSDKAGWIIAAIVLTIYVGGVVSGVVSHRRHGVPVRDPWRSPPGSWSSSAATVPSVIVCNKDRGVPFVLLLMIGIC